MRTNRFQAVDQDLCEYAVIKCFCHKWLRNDILRFIEKTAGIPKEQMILAVATDYRPYLVGEAIESVGTFLYQVVTELFDGNAEEIDDHMVPVRVDQRIDGITRKMRDVATLCIMHQLLEHLAKLMLEPLLKARIKQTQHASIQGRGQTSMKNQIARYLMADSIDSNEFAKTDVKGAYKHTKYSVVIRIIEGEIPRGRNVITLIKYLARWAPGGHLIIGGYLDAWLFNFVASYALRFLEASGRMRRGRFIKDVSKVSAYMDDFVVIAKTKSGLKRAIRETSEWMKREMELELVVKVPPTKTTLIDAAGYQIGRDRTVIRKVIWKRVRRACLRAWTMFQKTGKLRVWMARKIIAYNGYFRQTNSRSAQKAYHVAELVRIAKRAVRFHAWLANQKRKEKYDALLSRVNGKAGKS